MYKKEGVTQVLFQCKVLVVVGADTCKGASSCSEPRCDWPMTAISSSPLLIE